MDRKSERGGFVLKVSCVGLADALALVSPRAADAELTVEQDVLWILKKDSFVILAGASGAAGAETDFPLPMDNAKLISEAEVGEDETG